MSYIVSTSILGIQTFVTRFDPSDPGSKVHNGSSLPAALGMAGDGWGWLGMAGGGRGWRGWLICNRNYLWEIH